MDTIPEEELPRSLEEANKLLVEGHPDGCLLLQRLFTSFGEKLFKRSTGKWLKNFVAVLPHSNAEVRKISMQILTENQQTFVANESVISEEFRDVLMSKSFKTDMIKLIQAKEELFVLKLWETLVIILGKALHKGSTLVNSLLEVMEKCLQSRTSSIVAAALVSWKELIRNFTSVPNIVPARVRLLVRPMSIVKDRTPEILLAKCNTMWYLACSLGNKLIDHFQEVCVALLQLTFFNQALGDNSKVLSNRPATFSPGNCQEAQVLGYKYLIAVLDQVPSVSKSLSPEKASSANESLSTQLTCSIPCSVARKHAVALLKAGECALFHLSTTEKCEEVLLLVKLLIGKLDLMRSTEVKEEIEETVLFLKIVHTLLKENRFPAALSMQLMDLIVTNMPTGMLWSPLYQLDCTDMTSGVPAVTFLQLLLSTTFITATSDESFLSVFKNLITTCDDSAVTVIEKTLKFLQNQSDFSEISFQMWDLVSQQLLTLLETKNHLDLDYWKFVVENTLSVPLSFIMLKKLEDRGDLLVLKWIKIYRHYHQVFKGEEAMTHAVCTAVCRKLLQLWPPDLVDPIVLKDVLSLLLVVTEYIDIKTNNNFFDAASPGPKQGRIGNHHDYVVLVVRVLKSLSFLWSKENVSSSRKLSMPIELAMNAFNVVMVFLRKISSSSILADVLGKLAEVLSKYCETCPKNKQMEQKLENMIQCISDRINTSFTSACSPEFLVEMSPLLESTLMHPVKGVQDKSRQIFLRTFSGNYSILAKCNSLRKVLQQIKPPLVPNLDVNLEGDISSLSESSQEVIPYESPTRRCGSFLNRPKKDLLQLASPKKSPVRMESRRMSPRKSTTSKTLEELSQSEFIQIEPAQKSVKSPLTEHQKERLRQSSFVPAMYSDLSQQSSHSQLSQPEEPAGANDSFVSAKDMPIGILSPSSGSLEIIDSFTPAEKVQDVIHLSSSEKESIELPQMDVLNTTGDDSFFSVCCTTPIAQPVESRVKKQQEDETKSSEGSSDESTPSSVILPCGQDLRRLVVSRAIKKDQKIKAKPILEIKKLNSAEVERVEFENVKVQDRIELSAEKLRTEDENSPKVILKSRTKPLPVFPKLSRASLGNIENIPEDEDIIPSSLSSLEDSVPSEKPNRKLRKSGGMVMSKTLRSGNKCLTDNSWTTDDDLYLSTESSLSSLNQDPVSVQIKSPLTTKNVEEPVFTKVQEIRNRTVNELKSDVAAVEHFGLRLRRRKQYLELAGKRKRKSSVESKIEVSENEPKTTLFSKKRLGSSQESVVEAAEVDDELTISSVDSILPSLEMTSIVKRKKQNVAEVHVGLTVHSAHTTTVTRSKAAAKNKEDSPASPIAQKSKKRRTRSNILTKGNLKKIIEAESEPLTTGESLEDSKRLESVPSEINEGRTEIQVPVNTDIDVHENENDKDVPENSSSDTHEMEINIKDAPATIPEIIECIYEDLLSLIGKPIELNNSETENTTANLDKNQATIYENTTVTAQEIAIEINENSRNIRGANSDSNKNDCNSKNSLCETDSSESSAEKLLNEMGLASRTPSSESSDLIEVIASKDVSTEKPSFVSPTDGNKTRDPFQKTPVTVVLSDQDCAGSSEKSSTLSDENLFANPTAEFLEINFDVIGSESSEEQTTCQANVKNQKLDELAQSSNSDEVTKIVPVSSKTTTNSVQNALPFPVHDTSSQNKSASMDENLLTNLSPTFVDSSSDSDESLPDYKLVKKTEAPLGRNVVTSPRKVTKETDSDELNTVECQIKKIPKPVEMDVSSLSSENEDKLLTDSLETLNKPLEKCSNFDVSIEESENIESCQLSTTISDIVGMLSASTTSDDLCDRQILATVYNELDAMPQNYSPLSPCIEINESQSPQESIIHEENHNLDDSIQSSNSSTASSNSVQSVSVPSEPKGRRRRKAASPAPSPVSTRLRTSKKRSQEFRETRRAALRSNAHNKKQKKEQNVETFSQAWRNTLGSPDQRFSRMPVVRNSKTSTIGRSHILLNASLQKNYSTSTQHASLDKLPTPTRNSMSPSGIGILKHRIEADQNEDGIIEEPVKKRKVTFADPLVQHYPAVESKEDQWSPQVKRCLELSVCDTKSQEESLTPSLTLSDVCGDMSQDIDDSQSAVFPELIDCPDTLDAVLPQLSSSLWSRGLEELLKSRNITTVGHLSRLTVPEVKNLPMRSPKVTRIQNVLRKHLLLQKKILSVPPANRDHPSCMVEDPEQPFPPYDEHVSPSDSSDDEPLPSVDAALLELGAMQRESDIQESDLPMTVTEELSESTTTEEAPTETTTRVGNAMELQVITVAEPIDTDMEMGIEDVLNEVEVFVAGKASKIEEVVVTSEPSSTSTLSFTSEDVPAENKNYIGTLPFTKIHTENEHSSVTFPFTSVDVPAENKNYIGTLPFTKIHTENDSSVTIVDVPTENENCTGTLPFTKTHAENEHSSITFPLTSTHSDNEHCTSTGTIANAHSECENLNNAAVSFEMEVTQINRKTKTELIAIYRRAKMELAQAFKKVVPEELMNQDSMDTTDVSHTDGSETRSDLITETVMTSPVNCANQVQSTCTTNSEAMRTNTLTKDYIKSTSKDILSRLPPSVMLKTVVDIMDTLCTVVKDKDKP